MPHALMESKKECLLYRLNHGTKPVLGVAPDNSQSTKLSMHARSLIDRDDPADGGVQVKLELHDASVHLCDQSGKVVYESHENDQVNCRSFLCVINRYPASHNPLQVIYKLWEL